MDLSGLIFVALAVAWAAYLIPKALKHHEEVVRTRSVDTFSDSMRVLARREPVDRRTARLVVPGKPATQVEAVQGDSVVTTAEELAARRRATNRAARRRRRVLLLLLLANVAVVALATAHVFSWWWTAAPAGVLLAWLVACRLMVRRERAWRPSVIDQVVDALIEDEILETAERPALMLDDETGEMVAVDDPGLWDPVPVTLPTYVGKATARRTVRTIDLDSTGVWTSGRTEADSQLAREADEAAKAARDEKPSEGDRAVGS
ncbi:hypothetical protein ISU10_02590 [Nocardioides agariphilus]|uniref:Uncharacterized protein n=1 Tax=Nocardioides agariphilus TaxID=433664 RepID=A0A930VHD1_9ACTN|nr:hypothetical protein [Nocardioides agariphilus]MBF4766653.1 hypothetical protein [Nocardioides agariphilus]